jgi:hypothetical protein
MEINFTHLLAVTEPNLNLIFPILFSELTAGWHSRKSEIFSEYPESGECLYTAGLVCSSESLVFPKPV